MKYSGWIKSVIRILSIALILGAISFEAKAARWDRFNKNPYATVLVGGRFVSWVSLRNAPDSIQQTIVGEVQVGVTYRAFEFYGLLAKNVALSPATNFGGGIKLGVFSMGRPDLRSRSKLSALRLKVIFDFIHYSPVPPNANNNFTTNQFLFRFGGGAALRVGSKIFIEAQVMAFDFKTSATSGSWNIAPFFGFGYVMGGKR